MTQSIVIITTLVLCISSFSNLKAQNDQQNDSVAIRKIINDFYTWYISSIKDHKNLDYQPSFIENKEGYTTLYLDYYLKNLKNYKFSDSLLQNEANSYDDCIKNLQTVKFTNFKKTILVDLDDYEQYKCDFSNKYRWIGGQEICDGIKIDVLKFASPNRCEAYINKYTLTDNKEYFWWNNTIKVICIKTHRDWEINSIEIR